MHLGGIGTGNIEIGADGQLTTWQLFNTLRDGEVPFYFAVKTGGTAKLLQTAGGPEWPRINRIEMTGEYPVAILKFKDDGLPIHLELSAFTPFAPLDVKLSSMPLIVFQFRLHNPTTEAQEVSLAALMTNPVGYASIGGMNGCSHPGFGANITESFRECSAAGLFFQAQKGNDPTLDRPVSIYLLKDEFRTSPDNGNGGEYYASNDPRDFAIPPLDRPDNLKVQVINLAQPFDGDVPEPSQSIIWLDDAPVGLSVPLLLATYDAVAAGATLVLSGKEVPLLRVYGAATDGRPVSECSARPEIIFDDFENGYGKWTVTGDAFGAKPERGAMPGQWPVYGFMGEGLVNSFYKGDDATGKMVSQPFSVDRNFIRFLVGGGHYPTTQIRLIIDGKIVRATSGNDNEQLMPAAWDVSEFAGQSAHLEIVDEQKGGWGHINVDQIVFTDLPLDRLVLEFLERLLPIRFSALEEKGSQIVFQDCVLYPESKRSNAGDDLDQFVRPIGRGKVVLLTGRLLDPALTYSTRHRQKAYATLCAFAGASYTMTQGQSAREPGFGNLALAALAGEVTAMTDFTTWDEAWNEFSQHGRFQSLDSRAPSSPTPPGKTTNGALATTVSVPAGATLEVPFLFAWHYPNKYSVAGDWMGCHYATQWRDSREVMRDALSNYETLSKRTALFRQTFYNSTLPYWVLDAMTANAATIRHIGVVFRIANGDIYGWEGSNGSCDPTCTHVWGYEQALSRLFPDLEREMRRIDYFHQQNADGGINNRTTVPSPPHPTGERPFTDGHASCILKAYREALNSPDDSFFKEYWPRAKQAVEYLIDRDAKADGGATVGFLQDDQWNTYDEALHGITTFISGYYLAALRAGEEWARRIGEPGTADRYHGIFKRGQKTLVELCWNGEYFQQHLPDYLEREHEVGPGCMSDQLLGQWWAHQLDLGYILPRAKVVSALRSVFKYNWKSDLTGWKHMPRAFAGAKDKGLIMCTWPKGGRPASVLLYSDEVWTGAEYQVAAHMMYEGLTEEGLSISRGARDRYDGIPRPPIKRNPWCEIECGGHYTRAMSSWSMLLALSGFHYDGLTHTMRFVPSYQPENFKSFFCASEGWGSLSQKTDGNDQKVEIAVASGKLHLNSLELGLVHGRAPGKVTATHAGNGVPFTLSTEKGRCQLHFGEDGILLNEQENLAVTFGG
jgi:uncharacterized protein (DUF608 family)